MTYPVYDFNPKNLPTELLAAVGLAVTSFAQTEQFIQEAIAGCLGVDVEYGKAVTTHMAMPLRFSVLRSVAEIRIDDLDVLDELDRHLELLDEAVEKRNNLAHRQWCRNPKTGEVFTVKEKARTRLDMGLIPMPVDQVKADAAFIYATGIEFFQFLGMHNLLPSFPAAPRPREHKSQAARKKRRKNT